jgi:hypothetical protein
MRVWVELMRDHRAFFFGNTPFFQVTSAVSIAILTVLMFVAGAALVVNTPQVRTGLFSSAVSLSSEQGMIWPGNGWGYSCGSIMSLMFALRFLGKCEIMRV